MLAWLHEKRVPVKRLSARMVRSSANISNGLGRMNSPASVAAWSKVPGTIVGGLTIGLLDIAKVRGDVFLDRIEARLADRGLTVKRFQKPTNTRVAPDELRQRLSGECDVVVEALAD